MEKRKEFKTELVKALKSEFKNFVIEEGCNHNGNYIGIRKEENSVYPIFYINYLESVGIEEAINAIKMNLENTPDFDVYELIADKERVKKALSFSLVNEGFYEDSLSFTLKQPFLKTPKGLKVIMRISTADYSIAVDEPLLKTIGVTKEEAIEIATKQTKKKGIFVEDMTSFLNHLMPNQIGIEIPEENANAKMFVVTNNEKFNGAITILRPDVLKGIARKIKADRLILLPSSRHEFLVVNEECIDKEYAIKTVQEINRTVLDDQKDFLSDDIFIYDTNSDQIERYERE